MAAGRDAARGRKLHPWPVRVMHWTNAAATVVMIMSGWGIYNDYVIVSGWRFPDAVKLGSWAAESLQWHFAGMWVLGLNGLSYLAYGVATGRFREQFLPIRAGELARTLSDALRFRLRHEDVTVYNPVQKLLYVGVILAAVAQVSTGILLWKPMQFSGAVEFLGGFQAVRIMHFLGMSAIVGFLVVHVALALLVPSTLWAMLTGGPRIGRRGRD